jgi:tryptophanyl-tRNA synthetase
MGAPSRLFKLKIEFLPIKEESKRKGDAMVVVKKNIALWKIVQTAHTQGQKKMSKSKALTTIKFFDDSSSEDKTCHKTHGHKNLPSHPS